MEKFIAFCTLIVIAFFVALIFAWPIMLIWNAIMPAIFGLPTLTFWQTVGLGILCNYFLKPSTNYNK